MSRDFPITLKEDAMISNLHLCLKQQFLLQESLFDYPRKQLQSVYPLIEYREEVIECEEAKSVEEIVINISDDDGDKIMQAEQSASSLSE